MAKELVKVEQYRALQPEANAVELIRENLGGQSISEWDLARVKMPAGGGKAWEVPTLDDTEAVSVLQGVVLFFKESRSYWKDPYTGGNVPPDCSAADAREATAQEGISIPANANEEGHLLCDTCAYSEFGSAAGNGRGQACKLTRQVFLLGPERMLPMVVSLPPTSLKPAQGYFLSLADYGIDYKTLVTQIGLERVEGGGDVPAYSRATFKAGERMEGEQAERIAAYAAEIKPHLMEVQVQSADEIGG